MKITHNNSELIRIESTPNLKLSLFISVFFLVVVFALSIGKFNPLVLGSLLILAIVLISIFIWYKSKPKVILIDRTKKLLFFREFTIPIAEIAAVELICNHSENPGLGFTRINLKSNGTWNDEVLYKNRIGFKETEELFNFLERVLPADVKFEVRDAF